LVDFFFETLNSAYDVQLNLQILFMPQETGENLEKGSVNENDHAYEGKKVGADKKKTHILPLNVEKIRQKNQKKKDA
jgi:hypothetical protein